MAKVQLNIDIEKSLMKKIKQRALDEDTTQTKLVTRWIEEGLATAPKNRNVEFSILFNDKEQIDGIIDIETVDDLEPTIEYRYVPYSIEFSSRFPENPYDMETRFSEYEAFEKMRIEHHEEHERFIQCLHDFREERKTIPFKHFELAINQ